MDLPDNLLDDFDFNVDDDNDEEVITSCNKVGFGVLKAHVVDHQPPKQVTNSHTHHLYPTGEILNQRARQ